MQKFQRIDPARILPFMWRTYFSDAEQVSDIRDREMQKYQRIDPAKILTLIWGTYFTDGVQVTDQIDVEIQKIDPARMLTLKWGTYFADGVQVTDIGDPRDVEILEILTPPEFYHLCGEHVSLVECTQCRLLISEIRDMQKDQRTDPTRIRILALV